MSSIDAIRNLPSLANAELGRPVQIERYADVGTGWDSVSGTPDVEPDGLFRTSAVMPGTDAAMQGVIAESSSRTADIVTGEATSGSYFQPAQGDWLVLLDGPELHPDGNGLARMVYEIDTVDAITAGGGLRLGLSAPHAVTRALGGGTPSD